MSSDTPESMSFDGFGNSFGIVAARFNQTLVDHLLENVLLTLNRAGVSEDDIEVIRVPGSNEIPFTLNMLAETMEFDCLIALGVVVAGETKHHETIANSTGFALHEISIESQVPVINGIIVAENIGQAKSRCSGSINRGREFALAALEMAQVKERLDQRIEESDYSHHAKKFIEKLEADTNWSELLDEDESDEEGPDDWKK